MTGSSQSFHNSLQLQEFMLRTKLLMLKLWSNIFLCYLNLQTGTRSSELNSLYCIIHYHISHFQNHFLSLKCDSLSCYVLKTYADVLNIRSDIQVIMRWKTLCMEINSLVDYFIYNLFFLHFSFVKAPIQQHEKKCYTGTVFDVKDSLFFTLY